ncbi:DUF4381 domain-containing protein [Bordetella sp. LUAb4]|uniref:DUF4381 domain-containing protein n=1 Tax=Bordetella sp. LUAb4 TaxID=2843195 RepID=UPI001E5A5FA8|nr:DUF4381 domain-containing protein [Bordetella sp. LUAb4]
MSADLPGLDQLRELPLPAPVSYWPQTWGWAVLALAVLALGLYALVAWMRRRRRDLYRRQALAELARIQEAVSRQALAARQLPDLLKRTALAAQASGTSRQGIANRQPDVALPFPEDSGRLLATLAYAPDAALRELDPAVLDQLFDASRRWIEHHHVAA